MEVRDTLRYTKTHEWILKKNGIARIGITDQAQEKLTDIVFVELPNPGISFKKGDVMVTLESVKSVAEVYAPFTCTVETVNQQLNDNPNLINTAPYDDGWLLEIHGFENSELDALLTADEYRCLP